MRHFSGERDVIALGGYNGDCSYFDAEEQASQLQASKYLRIIPDSADTTTRGSTDCAYDRMVTLKASTAEDYTGHWGIQRFDQDYNLSEDQTVDVSDHYPVWADFKTDAETDGGPSS